MTASARDSPRRRWSSSAARADGGGALISASIRPAWSAARSSRSDDDAVGDREHDPQLAQRRLGGRPQAARGRRGDDREMERRVGGDRGAAVAGLGGLGHALHGGLEPHVVGRPPAHQRLQAGELQRAARGVQVAHVFDRDPHDLEPAVQRVDEQALALEPRQRGARDVARDAEPRVDLARRRSRVPGG